MRYVIAKIHSISNIRQRQIKALRTSDDLLLGLDKRIKKKADEDTNRYIFNNYQTKGE